MPNPFDPHSAQPPSHPEDPRETVARVARIQAELHLGPAHALPNVVNLVVCFVVALYDRHRPASAPRSFARRHAVRAVGWLNAALVLGQEQQRLLDHDLLSLGPDLAPVTHTHWLDARPALSRLDDLLHEVSVLVASRLTPTEFRLVQRVVLDGARILDAGHALGLSHAQTEVLWFRLTLGLANLLVLEARSAPVVVSYADLVADPLTAAANLRDLFTLLRLAATGISQSDPGPGPGPATA